MSSSWIPSRSPWPPATAVFLFDRRDRANEIHYNKQANPLWCQVGTRVTYLCFEGLSKRNCKLIQQNWRFLDQIQFICDKKESVYILNQSVKLIKKKKKLFHKSNHKKAVLIINVFLRLHLQYLSAFILALLRMTTNKQKEQKKTTEHVIFRLYSFTLSTSWYIICTLICVTTVTLWVTKRVQTTCWQCLCSSTDYCTTPDRCTDR